MPNWLVLATEALPAAALPAAALPPLPVALPLLVCALLLIGSRALPIWLPDLVAVLTSLAVAALCATIAGRASAEGPLVTWFGGWTPRDGAALGIGFSADAASAGIATFAALLFTVTLVFAWNFFDRTHGHFQILMLLFLAAMVGFCFTRDLFNLFVWFEVMSVTAFALTAYRLDDAAIAGAMTFTVTNSLAGILMLAGIGLLYARAGALDFADLAAAVARAGHDPVTAAAFCLVAAGLMIKAAVVPFQFWLADAHAVASSPVSVIFSGAMVAMGLFGLAKLVWVVFGGSAQIRDAVGVFMIAGGAVTALFGGWMALIQRHLKRLLAFSTISHAGIMLVGIGALSQGATAGLLLYVVGHGLVKGALFMVAGILLALRSSVDEIALRGRGRGLAGAGAALGLAGLLLGGLPVGLLDLGARALHGALEAGGHRLALAASLLGTAMTGAAVLRAGARIFLGWGGRPGNEGRAPTLEEQERGNRAYWVMLVPCGALLVLDLAAPTGALVAAAPGWTRSFTGRAALPGDAGALALGAAWMPAASVGLALFLAAFALFGDRVAPAAAARIRRLHAGPAALLNASHSGLVGDDVVWIVLGLAVLALALAVV